ncbi:dihydrofolate reductase [Streptomyces sp. WAC05374]|uniref:dihydrofolate reductase family protein n=1 Tax=Streptomyces sp. WAC05374 TaxID=2487420 RepID=UPI000F895F1C|nr:dihydrofolate reductase family protein [Streptomyces sp. WAC05374]RST18443.1 dihydrofolate reductase [Streptomyces sp. WAC05374]TDF42983.1 dihydrofolate reductase [Streptomyces sp. WAC05374]TDF46706.1 dihydrofolate reductase [Streptomyces sp. WAC05374]TDF48900.1 dihydrofolate reductase [Streptomyces sp. WAC05374]
MRKLTYLVACSIDGFIGDPGGDASSFMRYIDEEYLEFLTGEYPDTLPAEGRRTLGLDGVANKRFDTVVQGRGSYQLGLDAGEPSPYGHLREIVASRTIEESPHPNVEIVRDGIVERVRELKAEEGDLGIWLCGGSRIAGELVDEIDELVIKTYPQVYGSGMPMFASGFAIGDFALDAVRSFGNGVVVRWYSRR